MEQHPFIFSGKLSFRLTRHIVFWVCWWVFCSIIYSYIPISEILPFFPRFLLSAAEALIFLPVHMFVAYGMVYLLVPFLIIKGHYVYSIIAVALLFLTTG